jgi:putative thiamine transport system permease protein
VNLLRWTPAVTLTLLLLPISAGVGGVLLLSFQQFAFQPTDPAWFQAWYDLWNHPSTWPALSLTLQTSLLSTALSLLLSGAILSVWQTLSQQRGLTQALILPMALPHAAVAVGLTLLLAPSGWLWRWVTSSAERPPDIFFPHDEQGWGLVLGLVLKETTFLLLVMLSLLPRVPVRQRVHSARLLGFQAWLAWWHTVFPELYGQLRLPLWAVLAFSVGVVDVALILGPTAPPPFAVLVLQWAQDPLLEQQALAAAGALLQIAIVLGLIVFWLVMERLLILATRWGRHRSLPFLIHKIHNQFTQLSALLGGALFVGSLLALGLWSLSHRWPFPERWPQQWTLRTWERYGPDVQELWVDTAMLAFGSTVIALLLVIGWLFAETGLEKRSRRELWLYAPLLMPQTTFLFGVQILAVRARLDGTFVLLLWMHLLYVLPYVFLIVSDPWRQAEERFPRVSRLLGHGAVRTLWQVQLPLLLPTLLLAGSLGIAVSVAQYLPTVFAGAGRWATLTTEAVSVTAGYDRRVMGVFALAQAALPALVLGLGLGLAHWHSRRYRI